MATRKFEVEFIGDARQLQSTYGKVGAETAALNQKLSQTGRSLQQAGSRLSGVGRSLTTHVSLPAAAAGAVSVKMAVDFEDSMSKIRNLVGTSQKQVDEWSKQLTELAPTLGKSPQELADALYFVTSSGIKASKALDVVKVSAKASSLGLGETQTVADAVTSAMNAYGPALLDANEATNTLLQTVKFGKGEPDELAQAIGRVIPVSSKLKIPFNDVGASLAGLTLQGLDAAEATTALRSIFTATLKPTDDATKALDSVGLSAEEIRKSLAEKGTLATLQMLSDKFKGNEEQIARVFPNVRALIGAFNLTGKSAKTNEQIFDDMQKKTDDVGKGFDRLSKTDAFKLRQELAKLQAAAIEIGTSLLPVVNDIADVVGSIASAFSSMPTFARDFLIGAIAVGPLVRVAGAMLSMAGAVTRIAAGEGALKVLMGVGSRGAVAGTVGGGIAGGVGRGAAAGGGAAATRGLTLVGGEAAGAGALAGLSTAASAAVLPLVIGVAGGKAIDELGIFDRDKADTIQGLAENAGRLEAAVKGVARAGHGINATTDQIEELADATRGAADSEAIHSEAVKRTFRRMRHDYGSLAVAAGQMTDKQRDAYIDAARAAKDSGEITGKAFDHITDAFDQTETKLEKMWKRAARATGESTQQIKNAVHGMTVKVSHDYQGMVEVTGGGIDLLTSNTNKALNALGVTKEIKFHASPASVAGGGGGHLKQAGGSVVPGHGSGDKVPVRAMVEPGEGLFVLNRNAMGAFQTWNDMFPRFQKGGAPNFGGHPTNVAPGVRDLIGLMQAHFPLTVSSTTDHSALTSTGNPSDHATGNAVDLFADQGTMFKASEWIKSSGLYRRLKQGIHNPNLSVNAGQIVPGYFSGQTWAEHVSHIHLAMAGALSGQFGPVAQKIARVMIEGPPGPLHDIAQGAVDKVWKASNDLIARSAPTMVSGRGGGLTSAGGSFDKGELMRLWVQANGGLGDPNLMAAIALAESGGNPNATNPSGATGLWQILGNPFPGNALNPLTNAKMAGAKLRDQGLGAWVVYTSGAYQKYLQKGGMAGPDFGGWFGGGGSIVANKPTLFGMGERGTETATITRGRHSGPVQIRGKLRLEGGEAYINGFIDDARDHDRQLTRMGAR